METLVDAKGELNFQLLAKTNGITLLWYLLSVEMDFLFFFITGFTCISLLYAKQVFLFVFNILGIDGGDSDEDSASSYSSVQEDCVSVSEYQRFETTANEGEGSECSEDSAINGY